MAAPMPRLPPVMSAVLPVRLKAGAPAGCWTGIFMVACSSAGSDGYITLPSAIDIDGRAGDIGRKFGGREQRNLGWPLNSTVQDARPRNGAPKFGALVRGQG